MVPKAGEKPEAEAPTASSAAAGAEVLNPSDSQCLQPWDIVDRKRGHPSVQELANNRIQRRLGSWEANGAQWEAGNGAIRGA